MITCDQFFNCFVNRCLENLEKSLQSGFLERVDRVTVNATILFPPTCSMNLTSPFVIFTI